MSQKSINMKPVYFPGSKPLLILLVMLNKRLMKMIFEPLIDIYIKFCSCLRKFLFDYE